MIDSISCSVNSSVAPLAGAWIEIGMSSLNEKQIYVAPLAGAWIEIFFCPVGTACLPVAPLAGAWIEIHTWIYCRRITLSHPLRVRGLK